MELRAIEFNHDPMSSSTSALNVRRDATGFVTVPEWQQGQFEPSRVVYSIADTRGQTITIRVRLSSSEHAGRSAEVRARPASAPLQVLTSGVPWMSFRATWDYHASALGSVRARSVAFGADGESAFTTFELVDPPFVHRGVGVYLVTWEWQFRDGPTSLWRPLATTAHRVYALMDVPTAPWTQLPYDDRNTQLPWTDVLDWAAAWALGLRDHASAATAITWNVFALGLARIAYRCDFGAPSNYSFLGFDCTAFLERLAGGIGNGPNVNCSDCATIVSTFANVLGCDLWQSQMFDMLQPFPVKPLQLIGQWTFGPVCGTGFFNYHEVAWAGDCGVDDLVYDACLTGLLPNTLVSTVPAAMPFGRLGQLQYRSLLATPAGQVLCRPQPQNRVRRFVI
jgi:hypothetical protein